MSAYQAGLCTDRKAVLSLPPFHDAMFYLCSIFNYGKKLYKKIEIMKCQKERRVVEKEGYEHDSRKMQTA